jgi:alkyl sulfatase BDS1-like metallo-beta-lactamase superfamily hydrolase
VHRFTRDALQALLSLPDRLPGDATAPLSGRLILLAQNSASRGLGELLQTPARGVVLDALFFELARRLGGRRLPEATASVRVRVTGLASREPDVYELHFESGRCQVKRGRGERRPELTLTLDQGELVRLATGQTNPTQAVFSGRVRVGGDIAALAALFLTARQ